MVGMTSNVRALDPMRVRAIQPTVGPRSDARFTTLALKYSPARFKAYSAAWSARRLPILIGRGLLFEERDVRGARMITVRINRITSVTISVATPRCARG